MSYYYSATPLPGTCYLLQPDVDNGLMCKMAKNGWGVFDADAYVGSPYHTQNITLTIEPKFAQHMDHTGFNHSATKSTLSPKTDGRYILGCQQPKGEKTVQFTVKRPANMTDFGGEWVKLFRKDDWTNVTNEYEPFTFNQYGAKIPLLRNSGEESPGDKFDADPTEDFAGTISVYMVVEDIGDYEVMYGNKYLNTTNYDECIKCSTMGPLAYDGSDECGPECIQTRWVAVQFKQTLLRVGSPWADCSDEALATETYPEIGSIIPAYFGHPALNLQMYKDLAAEIFDAGGAELPVKVVLEIFDADTKLYTMSEEPYSAKTEHPKFGTDYSKCYKSGNACPEGHSVCRKDYCELDRWEQIIEMFQALPGVTVLGAVGESTTTSEYDILDAPVDGFFFSVNATIEDKYAMDSYYYYIDTVYALGEPLFNASAINVTDTLVTLVANDIGVWNPFSWYPHTPTKKWAAIVDEVPAFAMPEIVDAMFDRGYGYVFLTDKSDFKTSSSYVKDLLSTIYGQKSRRLLAADRQLSQPKYSWGCDDTGYHCAPVCLAQNGAVTTIAAEENCADAPMDICKCKCYYDAAWACHKGKVVCQATKGVETRMVGDRLCESRGTPKPRFEDLSTSVRQAGECEPVPTTRGDYPLHQCLTQWATTTTPQPEPEQEEQGQEQEGATASPAKEVEDATGLLMEVTTSFAAAASVLFALSQ
jgi:hypothetical protein